ncbi:MAG: allantoinase, partial [Pseudomonadota bacterium]|nr:allantoinase [Pseudomonadota bacterium]
ERDFIEKATRSIEQTTGQRPVGWLSRYLLTENTRRLLLEAGYTYHMDDYSDDQPFWETADGQPMLIMPYALDSNDMKMWTAPALSPADWLQYACDSFDWLYREGADQPRMMSLGLHLRIIGRPGRIGYFEKFLRHVAAHDGVWIATRAEIAEHWRRTHPFTPTETAP